VTISSHFRSSDTDWFARRWGR